MIPGTIENEASPPNVFGPADFPPPFGWTESLPSQLYDSVSRSIAPTLEGSESAGPASWTISIVSGMDVLFEKSQIDGQLDKITKYVYANGMRIAKINPDGTVHYFLSDHQGSTRKILDANRVEQYAVEYEPFGKPHSTSGPKPDPHQYTVEKHDDPTGLVYLRARQYDPEVGRFVSSDPVLGSLSRPQTLNRYAYVSNNPVNRVDPSGLYECWSGAGDRNYQTCLIWKSWHDTVANVNLGPGDFWTGMDLLMMGIGFIPVVGDIVSTVYFLGRDLQECLTSGCNWVNIGLDALGFLPLVPSLGGAVHLVRGVNRADDLVGATSQLHHIASNKGAWGEVFGRMFARGGMNLDDASNLVRLPTRLDGLPGHLGRHPDIYHRWVHARLTRATFGLDSADDYARALRAELDAIRSQLVMRPWYVSGQGISL